MVQFTLIPNPQQGTTCSICTDEIRLAEPCLAHRTVENIWHSFHRKCLPHWLQENSSCPNCRDEVGNAKRLVLTYKITCGLPIPTALRIQAIAEAFRSGDPKEASLWLENIPQDEHFHAVGEAIAQNHWAVAVKLLIMRPIDQTVLNQAAMVAGEQDHWDVIWQLEANGGQLDVYTRSYLAGIAADRHRWHSLERLLANGASVSAAACSSAIRSAASQGHWNTIRRLLVGALPLHQDDRSDAVRWAAEEKQWDIVLKLMEYGEEIHQNARENAVREAVLSNQVNVVRVYPS